MANTDVRLGLVDAVSRTKPPVLQFKVQDGFWRVWTAYNPSLTLGTHIVLGVDGTLQRVTVYPDYTTTLQRI